MTLWFRLTSAGRLTLGFVVLTALAFAIGRVGLDPLMIRTLLFGVLLLFALGLSVKNPAASMFFLILYVPLLGLLRRILIPVAGWGTFDPLVILEPVVVLLLGSYWFYRTYFLRESIVNDTRTFKLMRWMILIDVLEVINPKQGGLTVGYGGLIFYVVPLFWMVLSRQYLDHRRMKKIIAASTVMGVLVALYGLKQTYFGYFPFEQQWIALTNIISMNVYGSVRAVSTFTSAQEYATYLGVAMMFAWFYVLRGKRSLKMPALVALGVMGWALFMESARGPIVTTMLGMAMMTVFSVRRLRSRLTLLAVVGGSLVVVFIGIGHIHSGNGLIVHDVSGLTNPLHSSATGHLTRMWAGILTGLKMPIGYGLGSTTTAAGKFVSNGNLGTEVDISNMFVSDGVIGGVLYIALLVSVFYQAFRQAHFRSNTGLIAIGVLCAAGGQWVNGELYSVAALTWIIVGQLDRESPHYRTESAYASGTG
ncbi:hypothetical protein [Alicyclobacillus sp. ALC3]|uniref:hypothetical protein n=1 Tax=Alicyclobacillus sp. ALC3 TaxID=2796143 RepID=UPI002379C03A|nr:hypothetical protein [Alicyclobacillus sp. ALC3]WDL95257.1 hypothetical protein JC200_12605 [Alicyclobacillus sp. ALC3]